MVKWILGFGIGLVRDAGCLGLCKSRLGVWTNLDLMEMDLRKKQNKIEVEKIQIK